MTAIFQVLLALGERRVSQITNPNAFTKIGNMTDGGGLAAAFDGVTVQANAGSARGTTTNTGYVGLDFGVAKCFDHFILYSPSNAGFNGSGAATPAPTLSIRGSNSAVSNPASDGTLLVSGVCNGVTADVVSLTSTDKLNFYRYLWLYISGGSSGATSCAEMQVFERI